MLMLIQSIPFTKITLLLEKVIPIKQIKTKQFFLLF